ncbi:MAG: MmgE/PrpD family protein [Deltaproteobacteria bacterium]|nr:MmgE/PrpD family protein [Deltaproteobacteria bacterium]
MRDAIFDLAKSVVQTSYEDIAVENIPTAKMFILDTLGVALAGSTATGCSEVVHLIKEQGGRPDSSILVFGGKAPAQDAAFANSMMIHGRDFDDTHEGLVGAHCNVSVLPAALALAETKGASGKEFLAAVILGIDLMARIGNAAPLFHGWHNTATLGAFGAAAAAGKILRLSEDQMVNALGIAFSQAAGNRQGRADGALTKRMQPAFSARAGVFSALLAERGLTGAKNTLQGPWGFFTLYGDRTVDWMNQETLNRLTDQLGKRYEVVNLSAKPYPCCRLAHGAIEATLSLMQENRLMERDVQMVTIQASPVIYDTVGHPFQIRDNPQVDAQFSIPYTVAVAIQREEVTLEDFEVEVVKQPRTAELAKKVLVQVDEGLAKSSTIVNIHTNSGKSFSKRIDVFKGHPQNPLSQEEFLKKFRDCARFSAVPMELQRLEKILTHLLDMENIQNIKQIVELFV